MFEHIGTGNKTADKMLADVMKVSNRNKETFKLGEKVIYQLTSDKLIKALGARGSYAVAFTPNQKSFFGKEPKKKKVFIIEESGHPQNISKIIRQHEIGHFINDHKGGKRCLKHEFEADSYMAKSCGKKNSIDALSYIQKTCNAPVLSYSRLEILLRQAKILVSK